MIIRNNSSNSNNSANYDKKPTLKKNILFTIMIIAIFLIITIIYISLYVQVSDRNFRIEQLKEEKRRIESERSQIELEIARNRSIKRIEDIALNELDMERPDNVEYIFLNDESQQDYDKQEQAEAEVSLSDYLAKPINWLRHLTTVEAGDFD